MDVFKLSMEVDGRYIQSIVKKGVLATVETGKHTNRVIDPENRLCIMVQTQGEVPIAWVQVSKFNGSVFEVQAEGWLGDDAQRASTLGAQGAVPRGSISRASPKEAEARMGDEYGTYACCTSYGNGCYVKCCNSCCSDSTACPGASCCA